MQNSFVYIPRNRSEWSLALMVIAYFAAGLNHFRMPGFYYPLIPDYLGNKELLNVISGIAEMVLAIGLVFSKSRSWAAWGIIALLIAFLPAHIWFIQKGGCLDPNGLCVPVWVAWVRLVVIHPSLFWWAWQHTQSSI